MVYSLRLKFEYFPISFNRALRLQEAIQHGWYYDTEADIEANSGRKPTCRTSSLRFRTAHSCFKLFDSDTSALR